MTMLPVIGLRAVHLHCLDLQREVAQERLTASLAAPRWRLASRVRNLIDRGRATPHHGRPGMLDAMQVVRGIVARP